MKRYQVYLNPQSVSILDEFAEITPFTRSTVIQELIDGASSRLGNLLALVKKPKHSGYSELDKLVGKFKIKNPKTISITQRVDDIYYDK